MDSSLIPPTGSIVAWTFAQVDNLLVNVVARTAENAIVVALPFVTLFLTLSFIFYAFAIMRGVVEQPVMDFLGRALMIGIVTSIASLGGIYLSQIVPFLIEGPIDLAVAIVGNPATGASPSEYYAETFDVSLNASITLGSRLFTAAADMSMVTGLIVTLVSGILILAVVLLAAVGMTLIIVVKVAVGLLAAVGPLFILAYIFEPTRDLFKRWVSQLIGYFLLMLLFTVVIGGLINTLARWMMNLGLTLDTEPGNLLAQAVAVLVFVLASLILIYMLPGMASSLAGSFGSSLGSAASQATRHAQQGASALTRVFRR